MESTQTTRQLDDQELALAAMLGVDPNEKGDDGEFTFNPCQQSYDHLGLTLYEVDGEEWAVGTDAECDRAAADYIRESLWAFNADFLAGFCGDVPAEMIAAWQEKCEEANGALLRLVGGNFEDLVEQAIASDGRGHFMSSYDGNESEAEINGEWFFGYRVN